MELYQPVSPLRAGITGCLHFCHPRPPHFDNLLRARISWIQPVPGLPPTCPPHPSTPLPARTSQLPARITGLPLQASPQLVLPIRPYYQPVLPARITSPYYGSASFESSYLKIPHGPYYGLDPASTGACVLLHLTGRYGLVLRAGITGWYYGSSFIFFFQVPTPPPLCLETARNSRNLTSQYRRYAASS